MGKARETLSKAAGAAKKAGAKLRGEPGILATLKKEHAEVSALMKQVNGTSSDGRGVRIRSDLFPKIFSELMSHAKAEEKTFYATLQRFSETADKMQHSTREHQDIENMLSQLKSMGFTEASWGDVFTELVETVEHHVQEEEHVVFKQAQQLLSTDELHDLDRRFKIEKERLRKQYLSAPVQEAHP